MIDAYGLHIGPLYIHFYALILVMAIFVGTWFTARRAKSKGEKPEMVWDIITWALLPGIIGARLYHVLTPTPASGLTTQYYFQHPLEILAIWNGGLGIYGAVLGGAVGIILYAKYHHIPILRWLDLAMPGLLLGQAIGRWGNFVNNELYGAPTKLPWAINIPPEKRLPGYEQYSTFHPLFLYESLWNLASFGFILWLERRYRQHLREGDLVLIYLVLYPVGRFLLDFVRLDSNGIGPLTTAQWASLAAAITASALLAIRHLQPRIGVVLGSNRKSNG